ncbi:CCA tRNA nucleotidyltransferase [Oscillospiraceae bacterium LCP25S3_E10]
MNIKLPKDVIYILQQLENGGFSAYVVGGCVRDALLGKAPQDWDICTSALPQQVINTFSDYRVIKTGIKHGTVTLMLNDSMYEITTFRTEKGYSDNRRPDTVKFVADIKEDLSRRDFTINAMAYNPKYGFIDLFGGLADLDMHIIRTVGNADVRFNEDALRILRALRFSAKLCFNIEKSTAASVHHNKSLLNNIAVERIFAEFKQLLLSENAVNVLREYQDVISVFIPEISSMIGFCQHNSYHCYDVWEHTLHALTYAGNNIIIRLAVLFHDIGKPHSFTLDQQGIGHFYGHCVKSAEIAENILKRLRCDTKTTNTVVTLVKNHDRIISANNKSVKKTALYLGSEEMTKLLITVKKCDAYGQSPELFRQRLEELNKIEDILNSLIAHNKVLFSVKELKINGNDLINMGVKDGRIIGAILNSLLKSVNDENIDNTYNSLVKSAKKKLEKNL